MPQLATSTMLNPIAATAYDRRSVSGTVSMRWNPHHTAAAPKITHQYADAPNTKSMRSAI
ncbi:hypothetical protein D3C83_61320 [compost metagenome]